MEVSILDALSCWVTPYIALRPLSWINAFYFLMEQIVKKNNYHLWYHFVLRSDHWLWEISDDMCWYWEALKGEEKLSYLKVPNPSTHLLLFFFSIWKFPMQWRWMAILIASFSTNLNCGDYYDVKEWSYLLILACSIEPQESMILGLWVLMDINF